MEGAWPGVVAICGDADIWCIRCARKIYGEDVIEKLITGTLPKYVDKEIDVLMKGIPEEIWQETKATVLSGSKEMIAYIKQQYPRYVIPLKTKVLNPACIDHEGNPLTVVLYGSEALQDQYCGNIKDHAEPYPLWK